jgi:hypothetical protein
MTVNHHDCKRLCECWMAIVNESWQIFVRNTLRLWEWNLTFARQLEIFSHFFGFFVPLNSHAQSSLAVVIRSCHNTITFTVIIHGHHFTVTVHRRHSQSSFTVIIHSHHFTVITISIHSHQFIHSHSQSSFSFHSHLQSSFTVIIHSRHLVQSSFAVIIHSHRSQSSFTLIIHSYHSRSSFSVIIHSHHTIVIRVIHSHHTIVIRVTNHSCHHSSLITHRHRSIIVIFTTAVAFS